MIKIHLQLLFITIFLLCTSHAKEVTTTKEQNLSTIKLVKVNNHIITSDVLGPKKVHAFIYKFTPSEREAIVNQLINDEIATQYSYKYLQLEDNISNEKERLNLGLTQINKIALDESMKSISDKESLSFYKKNKKDFWHEKDHEVSHIMLNDKNLTIELIQKLEKSSDLNSTFQKLAKKYSTDRSAKQGGYLGHFESKIMVKPFRDALEKLKIGKYTHKPIKTAFGYHIILLHNIIPKGYFTYEEVKETIQEKMAKKIKPKWFEDTLLPLKNKAKINYIFDLNSTH